MRGWSYSLPVPAGAPVGHVAAQERARKEVAVQGENRARLAVSEHQVQTVGVGNLRHPEIIKFAVVFLEEPQFNSGTGLVKHPSPTAWFDPAGTSTVRSWVQNDRGLYIGVRMAFRVEMDRDTAPEGATPPAVELVHFLTFTGVAYKNILGVQHDLDDMTPHSIDF